jgi:hypothetical protein
MQASINPSGVFAALLGDFDRFSVPSAPVH